MDDSASRRTEVLIVGAGPAAHAFVAHLLGDPCDDIRVTVIGDEGRLPYDRTRLYRLVRGDDPADLDLDRGVFRDDRVRLIRDDRVRKIDRKLRRVRTRSGRVYMYDVLVLATGRHPVRPTLDGAGLPGCFTFQSAADASALRAHVHAPRGEQWRRPRATVVGDGPGGFAAALALAESGVEVAVVHERGDHADPGRRASAAVDALLRDRGIAVRRSTRITRIDADESGAVASIEFHDGSFARTDAVVFAPAVRPRDELARNAGLTVVPGGGVLVDADGRTSDPHILAVGSVAVAADDEPGQRAPGGGGRVADRMREAVATTRTRWLTTIVRAGGVEFTDLRSSPDGETVGVVVPLADAPGRIAGDLLLSEDGRVLLGATVLGDEDRLAALRAAADDGARARAVSELLREHESAVTCGHALLTGPSPVTAVTERREHGLSGLAEFPESAECAFCARAVARRLIARAGAVAIGSGRRGVPERGPVGRPRTRETVLGVTLAVAGELSGAQLVLIGRLADEHGLRVRPSDGGVLELRGASAAEVPAVLGRLRAAGLEAATRDGGGRFVEARTTGSVTRRREESPA
ncbi:NAD(P)/FAD-dependent oxidoreductase [Microbacterium sp. NPDC055502]